MGEPHPRTVHLGWRPLRALLLGVAVTLLPLSASAQTLPAGEPSVRISWAAASGPVSSYEVRVSVNGGPMDYYEAVPDAQATIYGPQFQIGDALRFQVFALSDDGRRGPGSPLSDVIFFGAVPVPQNVTAVNGTPTVPNQIDWDPVPGVDFYLVFRAQDGGTPQQLARTLDPWLDDDSAPLGVRFGYTVTAVSQRRFSASSPTVYATRTGVRPKLVSSVASLSAQATPAMHTLTQTIELHNTGDWALSWSAWASLPWVSVSPSADLLDDEVDTLSVTYNLDQLGLGAHDAEVRLYTYYDPPLGETFELGPPLVIPIHVTIRDQPTTIDVPPSVSLGEGQVIQVPVHAADPDPGSDVALELTPTVPFASLALLGGGNATLTLAPGAGDAGSYTVKLVAWDRNQVSAVTVGTIAVTVTTTYVNSPPIIAAIPNQTAVVGQTTVVNVQAIDPDGDRIAFTTSALPDFVQFTDNGNGTGQFVVTPSASDVSTVFVVLGAVDDGSPPLFVGAPFQITVAPQSP